MAAAAVDTATPAPESNGDGAVAAAAADTRKRPAAVSNGGGGGDEQSPPPTKRRRQTASTPAVVAPKRAAGRAKAPAKKAAVKAKAAAKKSRVVPKKKKKKEAESDSDDSDSDSESSDSDESVSSSSDSEMADAPAPKAATAPKPATPKKPAPDTRTSTPAAEIIKSPRRRLTASAIDELVPLILRNERPSAGGSAGGEDDGKVVVISSLKLQAVLARFTHKRAEVTSDNVHKLLGLTRKQTDNAEVIAVVLHGPTTENERVARLKYEGECADNYHWSLACWFRSLGDEIFHYDSSYPLNDKRCGEVLGVLRSLGVLPTSVSSYVVPEFFPLQEYEWECGYKVLIALTIIASSPAPAPVSEADVNTSYRPFFTTLNAGTDAIFIKRMHELLTREKYASV